MMYTIFSSESKQYDKMYHAKENTAENPIESTFATVWLRHKKTKGNGTRKATLTMVYKLCKEAEKGWRKLQGFKLIPLIVAGKKFKDGELVDEAIA